MHGLTALMTVCADDRLQSLRRVAQAAPISGSATTTMYWSKETIIIANDNSASFADPRPRRSAPDGGASGAADVRQGAACAHSITPS